MTSAVVAATGAETQQLTELSDDECKRLLGNTDLGRIAFVIDGRPIVLPVNYRFVSGDAGQWVLLRTRPGNTIDAAPSHVAFEIDGIDRDHYEGWSVLVRGVLHHLDPAEIEVIRQAFDPRPWPQQQRTSWLAIKPQIVTGRRLHGAQDEWSLPSEAYL